MHTYTNVMFDRSERDMIERAGKHLGVAFPGVWDPAPRKSIERSFDQTARVVLHIAQDTTVGTHDNISKALHVMKQLVATLAEQSELDYWLDQAAASLGGERPAESSEPFSPYQQAVVMAESRTVQLSHAMEAVAVLQRAVGLATPRVDHERELV